jgi:hypothetical protein
MAIQCAVNEDLKTEWQEYLVQSNRRSDWAKTEIEVSVRAGGALAIISERKHEVQLTARGNMIIRRDDQGFLSGLGLH